MHAAVKRMCVFVGGVLAGAICLALYSVHGMPESWKIGMRVQAWAQMMSGPFLAFALGWEYPPSVLGTTLSLALLTMPAILAHPLKPNALTAALTLIALFFWFAAGWMTMLAGVWGA